MVKLQPMSQYSSSCIHLGEIWSYCSIVISCVSCCYFIVGDHFHGNENYDLDNHGFDAGVDKDDHLALVTIIMVEFDLQSW